MIDESSIKKIIQNIVEYKYKDESIFTVLPPSCGEPSKLRIYGYGGLLAKIAISSSCKKDIELMNSNYIKYEKELDDYLNLSVYDSGRAVELLSGESNDSKKFLNLAASAMCKKFTKESTLPKEREVQNKIVKNFMRKKSNWKVLAQEVQFKEDIFADGKFSDSTSTMERFDLIVCSDRGLGFVELKVNNDNCENLNSHYEHMQFVKENPKAFLGEIDKRFEMIKKYNLWGVEDFSMYDKTKIWFGFLFVNGNKDKSIELVKQYFCVKDHLSDSTYFMYYSDEIEKLDINNMVSYSEFIKE